MSIPFSHLLAAHRPRVLRAALGWVGNEQEAREVAQVKRISQYQVVNMFVRVRRAKIGATASLEVDGVFAGHDDSAPGDNRNIVIGHGYTSEM